jgi:tetratricopeptide (TPR) repeat protein
MKKTVYTLLIAILGSVAVQAQEDGVYGEDSIKCRENIYIYYELAKKKQYLEAWDGWHYVYENCPGTKKFNFIYGTYIVEAKIKEAEKAKNDSLAQIYKDLLLEVYDGRNKYFPGQEGYVAQRKALDMVQHFPDSSMAAYQQFNKALEIDGPEQSAAFYNYFFVTAARLFNDDAFTVEDVFTAYNVVMEGIEVNNNALNTTITEIIVERDSNNVSLDAKRKAELEKAERELDRYTTVESNIEKILAPIATCSKLGLIYNEESFTANSNDTLWLKRAVKMLQKERENGEGEMEDCTDNPIYFKISDALYKLEPSAPSARAMYIMAVKDKNYSKAAGYINQAIDFEIDPLKKANDYLKLSRVHLTLGSYSAAKSAALKAASNRKNWGAPYIVIAQAYAAADGTCGSNIFEKKAVYWAAVGKLQYAQSIDPSVSAKANRLITSYKNQYPAKSVIFALGHVEGEKYTIGCWINETITVKY